MIRLLTVVALIVPCIVSAEAAPHEDAAASDSPGFDAEELAEFDQVVLCSGIAEITVEAVGSILRAADIGSMALPVMDGRTAATIKGRTLWVILDDRTLDAVVAGCARRATTLQPGLDGALDDQFGEGPDERRLSNQAMALPPGLAMGPPYMSTSYLRGDHDAASVTFSLLDGNDLQTELANHVFALTLESCDGRSACEP